MSGGDAGKNSEEDLSRFLAKVDQIGGFQPLFPLNPHK